MKKGIKLFALVLCAMLVLVACSNDSSSDSPKQTDDKDSEVKKEETEDFKVSDLLAWERTEFSDSEHKEVIISEAHTTDRGHYPLAYKGVFLLAGNSMIDFFDYHNGKMYTKLEDVMGPTSSIATPSSFDLIEDYFYGVSDVTNTEGKHIIEINLKTGKEKILLPAEGKYYGMDKQDNILFLEHDGKVTAFDTKNEEIIWEVEDDTNMSFYDLLLTDKSVVLYGDEGMVLYNQENGEKQYEVRGYFVEAEVDGEDVYVLELTEEALLDDNQWHVLKFNENIEEPEELFTTPEMEQRFESEHVELDIDENMIYIKLEYGLLAYDKKELSQKWATAINGEFDTPPMDEPSYDFETDYFNGNVYTRVQMTEAGEENETILAIIDGKTGEMKENYTIKDGNTFGPLFDGESVVVYYNSRESPPKVYILK